MTALRNRQHLIEGKSMDKDSSVSESQNHNMTNGFLSAKKKLIMLEEEEEENISDKNNNYNNNNYAQSDEDDKFADAQTIGAHPKLTTKEDTEQVPIYGSPGNAGFIIGETVRDQFAVALLKLQTGLDSTSRRLQEIEGRVESLNKQQNGRSNLNKTNSNSNSKDEEGFFGKRNLMGNLIYLSWPIVVFLAMRAIERRSSLANKLA